MSAVEKEHPCTETPGESCDQYIILVREGDLRRW